MRIPDKCDFQPSAGSLKQWLSTRKGDLIEGDLYVGGINMPRYFSDVSFSTDQFWFLVAILGEFIGLAVTVIGGWRSGGSFFVFATITVIMFIFCDFFFAYKLHRNKGDKCKLASLLLVDGTPPAELARIRLNLRKGRFGDFMYQSGIIIIAITKVIGIMLLGVFIQIILYVPFAIIYFIVAYIHLQHTGYYFAYNSTQKSINRDYLDFAQQAQPGIYQAQEKQQHVTTTELLVDLPIKHNPHEITEVKGGSKNDYIIKAKGVLTDEDIIGLIDGQSAANRIILFKACRELQLTY